MFPILNLAAVNIYVPEFVLFQSLKSGITGSRSGYTESQKSLPNERILKCVDLNSN